MKGANGEDSQKEREILLIFLKGTKEVRKAKLEEPDLYNEIENMATKKQTPCSRTTNSMFFIYSAVMSVIVYILHVKLRSTTRTVTFGILVVQHWIIFHHQPRTKNGLMETNVVENVLGFVQDIT
jgi:hypothetical protein